MENAEEVFQFLEEFSKRKPKTIPQELNDYLTYVARTGDPVYQWSLVKSLFKEKLLNVITDFHESTPSIDILPCPNVDPFNYDIMKNSLVERLDSFSSAPFTVQRICELLTCPRKQYNRVDKFMRAIEKNILVVSTREPGLQRQQEPENGEALEPIVNGSDNNSEYNVDVEMEDMSWKDNSEIRQNTEPQPGSSDAHISVNDLEERLQAKQEASMEIQEKQTAEYESVTPPELNIAESSETEPGTEAEPTVDDKPQESIVLQATQLNDEKKVIGDSSPVSDNEKKCDVVMQTPTLIIPDIKVDNVEMTEQKLIEQANLEQMKENREHMETTTTNEEESIESKEEKPIDEHNPEICSKDDTETKNISENSSSSEESSASSENIDGNSDSPPTDIEVGKLDTITNCDNSDNAEPVNTQPTLSNEPSSVIESENYSITDVNSELPQIPPENKEEEPNAPTDEQKEESKSEEIKVDDEITNTETTIT